MPKRLNSPSHKPRFKKPRHHRADAHRFDIYFGSLISVFSPGAGILNAVGFNVDIWRLPILDDVLQLADGGAFGALT